MSKIINIHTIEILPFGMINAFLVCSDDGNILIDAGLPRTEAKIENKLRQLSLKFEDIDLIVITHAHIDHAGNAALLRRLTGAPIIGHEGDLDYYLRKKKMTFCPTGGFGKLFLKTGALTANYEDFMPDILMKETDILDLTDYGFDGSVIPTPGHTEGSISVLMQGDYAFVGDLISSGILLGGIMMKGRAKRPPFEDDPQQVADELEKILDQNYGKFYMGHGGPLPHDEVARHVKNLRKIV